MSRDGVPMTMMKKRKKGEPIMRMWIIFIHVSFHNILVLDLIAIKSG